MAVHSDPFKLIGTIVDGRYRVEKVAGQGGFGIVYRAHHLSFESPVALKVLKVARSTEPNGRSEQLARFKREGKVLFELCSLHPSIVRAFETGTIASSDHATLPYLALEWLDGVSLDQELKYRRQRAIAPMTLSQVIRILDEPAAAMTLAHERGVAHRDIKPSNLFVSFQAGAPIVKILDFGIAKILDTSTGTTTQFETTGAAPSSFTPMYAAPEQWLRRLGATGTWTDVHAWALVCLELLTGKPALTGEDPAQFMAAALDAEVRPTPSRLGLQVPPEVEAVFGRAVAIDPRDRFPDLGEFWAALCRAVRGSALANEDAAFPVLHAANVGERIVTASDSARTSQPSTTSLPSPTPPTASRMPHPVRSVTSRRAAIGGGVRAAIGGGVLAVLGLSVRALVGREPPHSEPPSVEALQARADPSAEVEQIALQPTSTNPSANLPPPVLPPRDSLPPVSKLGTARVTARAVQAKPLTIESPESPSTSSMPSTSASLPARPPTRPPPPRSLDQLLQNEEFAHRR
jgi:serine/threonine protein kinase